MTRNTRAVLALLGAGVALQATQSQADVTPAEVWADIERYMTDFGYTVTATEMAEGNTLTVTDVVMDAAIPDTEGDFTFSMDRVVLRQQPGGSVAVDFPPRMPISVTFVPEPGEPPVTVVIDYTHDALEMIVSGDPDAMVYDYTANALGFELTQAGVPGVQLTDEAARFVASMGPVSGRSTVTTSDTTRSIVQELNLGDVSYDAFFADPEGSGSGSFTGTMRGVTSSGDTVLPVGVDLSDPAMMFTSGVAGSGRFAHQGGETNFNVTDAGQQTQGTLSSTSGQLEVAFADNALRYLVGGTGTDVQVAVPDLPFPIVAQIGESLFELAMPLGPTDAGGPRDAGLVITLADFTMSDAIWALFDPGQVLPRDPATIALDLDAQVTPLVDMMTPEAMEQAEMQGDMPVELNSATLNDLRVSAVGGQITGEGAFTFDNTDLDTFDGMPRPEGELRLNIAGINGIIDNLIQMGLLAEQDAMGARMMMSMFTVPGSAPDSATSTITINAQGHILANGQRIQ